MTDPTAVDWAAVYARLAALAADPAADPAAGGASRATPSDAAAVLAARARALARPTAVPASGAGATDAATALGVAAAGARWLVPLAHVLQVVRASGVTPLPGAERPVAGVVPWRGRVLAVLVLGETNDLGTGTAGRGDGRGDDRRVLILADGAAAAGLLVDAVGEVQPLDPAAVHAGGGAPGAGPFAAGLTADAAAVLDVPALLRAARGG